MKEQDDARAAKIDASIAKQLQRSIARNGRLVEAVRIAINLLEENGLPVEASKVRTMAAEALIDSTQDDAGRSGDGDAASDPRNPAPPRRDSDGSR